MSRPMTPKTVVRHINDVFGTTFNPWMADAQTNEARKKWLNALEEISKLNPEIVISAHADPQSEFILRAVEHIKNYILFHEEALKTHKTSNELIQAIKNQYPNLAFESALILGAKVNTGEMKW
ncbi:hypothetical protein [Bergeyella sp. RCAD1439]|uniref:hypothetical protein n=1 Tax=Bergeyella anatis TaxID=3113737 RepID=UPI002E19E34D|nr:hypothetical protein [Bergeyella sp. RCAD1439]